MKQSLDFSNMIEKLKNLISVSTLRKKIEDLFIDCLV
jgi:hypothetical protein